jgi:hypothetical protein
MMMSEKQEPETGQAEERKKEKELTLKDILDALIELTRVTKDVYKELIEFREETTKWRNAGKF